MATLCIVVNSSLSIGGWVFGYFVSVREIMVQSFEMDFPQFSGYLEQITIYSKHKKIRTGKTLQMQFYILYHYLMDVAVFMLSMHFLLLMLMFLIETLKLSRQN